MSPLTGGRIPDTFIESVLSKTDIVSVIEEKLKLKKNGANYTACCPFHHEKTPSFTVSQTKQFYHCFGCGAHGDAIRFLMEHEGLNFVDALERLSQRLGLTVPKDPDLTEKVQKRQQSTSILNQVSEYYQHQLKHHTQSAVAIEYLKKRGLTGQVAKHYSLGFAPPGWDNLIKHFQSNQEAMKVLEETGLIIKHATRGFYDRFRDRIMFPIRDRRGQVYGFGARVLDDSLPKYLNSPESKLFQKGHSLYGLFEALQAIRHWEKAIVVEGYMDVVALSQLGVQGGVATLGTAVTAFHIEVLYRHVKEIVFCFDGDKAGQQAAFKALQIVLPYLQEGRQAKFMHLPPGDDPDSFIRQQGKEAFFALIENATPLSEYFLTQLSQQFPPNSVDNRAALATKARALIETIPNGIFKEMMFEQLAELVSSTPQVVRGERAFRPYTPKKYVTPKPTPAPMPLELGIMASAILLCIPELYEAGRKHLVLFSEIVAPGIRMLEQLIKWLSDEPTLSSDALREKLQAHGFELAPLRSCENKLHLVSHEALETEFHDAIKRLEVIGREQILEKLLQKARTCELSDEEKRRLKEILYTRESI